jgi:glycosyltransferase involved in cell wall biosynthesis
MRIAFIHQNMPGQYRGLMPYFASNPEHEVVAIGEADNVRRNFGQVPRGLKLLGYQMPKHKPPEGHPFLASTEYFTYRGETLARVLVDLKKDGFSPDVICSHPGWGESLFIKDVFPNTRLINYCEFFYDAHGRDFNFDPEFPEKQFAEWNLRTRNAIQLLSLNSMDSGISPMQWQKSSFPREYIDRISVIHEGVDTEKLKPDPNVGVIIKDSNQTLTAKDEIITFVSRNLEPYRGFHIFMRALPDLLKRRPKARVLIVGGDEVSYGKVLASGSYRLMMMNEVGSRIDMSRVFFLGKVPYTDYVRILQISTAHVYLTYPFVLSWSMLEAMSLGCVIVGSRTPPVQEVIEDGKNGVLVNFFSPQEIVDAVERVCESKDRMQEMRTAARQTIIDRFDFNSICVPQQIRLIENKPMLEHPARTAADAMTSVAQQPVAKAEKKTLSLKPQEKAVAAKPAPAAPVAKAEAKKLPARPVKPGKSKK